MFGNFQSFFHMGCNNERTERGIQSFVNVVSAALIFYEELGATHLSQIVVIGSNPTE